MCGSNKEKSMDNEFVLEPTKTKLPLVGLVDADAIMYNIGWRLNAMGILNHIDFSQLVSPPNIIYQEVNSYMENLTTDINVDSLELHFTASNKNKDLFEKFTSKELRPQFRTTLGASYKDNRPKTNADLPFAYHQILQVLLERYTSYLHDQWEADDSVCLLKRLRPEYVLCSNDKDVYKQSVGTAYQFDKRRSWSTTTIEDANIFPYIQAITGDPTDGYDGVKGIGAKGVCKFINPNMTPIEMWEGVVRAHNSVGNDWNKALWNMRMSSMNQLDKDGKLQLWEPPTNNSDHVYTSSGIWTGL